MRRFLIETNIGALPLRFGMTPNEVEIILGPPLFSRIDTLQCRSETRDYISIGYSEGTDKLETIAFTPGIEVSFQGRDLFGTSDVIAWLSNFDTPYELVGFLVFKQLGLQLGGFHNPDTEPLSIHVMPSSFFDEFTDLMSPYSQKEADDT